MRHLRSGSKLGKQPAHRRAVLRNLVTNLIEKERIHTTILRAKAARPHRREDDHARQARFASRSPAGRCVLDDPRRHEEALRRSRAALRRSSRRLHADHPHRLAHRRRRRTRNPGIHRLGVEEEGKEAAEGRRRRSSGRKRREGSGRRKITNRRSEEFQFAADFQGNRIKVPGLAWDFCFSGVPFERLLLPFASAARGPTASPAPQSPAPRFLRWCRSAHRPTAGVRPGTKRLVKFIERGVARDDGDGGERPGEARAGPPRANSAQNQQAQNEIFGEVRRTCE